MQKIWHKWWQWGQILVTRVLIANMILVLSPINLDFLILTHRLSPPWTRYKVLPDHKAGLAALPDREGVGNAGHHTLPFSILPHKAHTHIHTRTHTYTHTHTGEVQQRGRKGRRRAGPIPVPPCLAPRLPAFPPVPNMHGTHLVRLADKTGHSWSLLSPCTFFSALCLILSFF